MNSTTEKFENTTDEILQDCVDLRATRKKQYGGNVFKATAKIGSAIGLREYTEDDVHILFLAMKLARYKFQLMLAEGEDEDDEELISLVCEETTCDSLEDAIVYMALWESQRRTRYGNHQKRQARHAAENVQPRDRESKPVAFSKRRQVIREELQEESS